MRHLIYACVALALTVSGCATTQGPTQPAAASSASTASLRLTQAYAGALEGYTALSEAYLAAVDAGVLKGASKDQAKSALTQAYSGLRVARTAREAHDTVGALAALAGTDNLLSQARALIPALKK